MYFYSIVFQNLLFTVLARVVPTHLLITRAGPCIGNQIKPIVNFSELYTKRHKNEITIRGQFNISRDIQDGWNIKARMQKCQDIRNIDTCDYLKSFTVVRDGCRGGDSGETLYETFLHFSRPLLRCPIKAGAYSIADFPFYTGDNYLTVSEAKLSTSVFGYTLRLEASDAEVKLMCVDVYLKLLYIRNRDWLQKGNINNSDTTTDAPPSHSDEFDDQVVPMSLLN